MDGALARLLAAMPSLQPYAATLAEVSPDLIEELAVAVKPIVCEACGARTSQLHSRTADGAQYCLPCIKRGAGLGELLKDPVLRALVSQKEITVAKANGFL